MTSRRGVASMTRRTCGTAVGSSWTMPPRPAARPRAPPLSHPSRHARSRGSPDAATGHPGRGTTAAAGWRGQAPGRTLRSPRAPTVWPPPSSLPRARPVPATTLPRTDRRSGVARPGRRRRSARRPRGCGHQRRPTTTAPPTMPPTPTPTARTSHRRRSHRARRASAPRRASRRGRARTRPARRAR